MKNLYSFDERNRIVEKHLPLIRKTILRNSTLMKAAHLDYDDVYQQLAIRLIRCVEGFDPAKGKLKQHIEAQLQYELLNCKNSYRRYGLRERDGNRIYLVSPVCAITQGPIFP